MEGILQGRWFFYAYADADEICIGVGERISAAQLYRAFRGDYDCMLFVFQVLILDFRFRVLGLGFQNRKDKKNVDE